METAFFYFRIARSFTSITQIRCVRFFFFFQVNHFPGAFHMGRKDRLWQHINEMILLWGIDEYQLMPTTYILPSEYAKLKIYLRHSLRDVIVKPVIVLYCVMSDYILF